jgi:hypothetical protein
VFIWFKKEKSMAKGKGSSSRIWVSPRPNGRWGVHREGAKRDSWLVDRKADAERLARELAKREQGELIIQKQDGTIQKKDSYGSDPLPPRDTEH